MINQLVKFGIIGSMAALTNLLVVFLLVQLTSLHPLVSNVIAFLVAFNVSFWGHRHQTFKHTPRRNRESMPRFFIISAAGFVLNEGLYYLFLHHTQLQYMLSLLIVIFIVACFTFTLGKFWAFKA